MRERGSVSVELVLVTPLLICLLLFVVAGGRLATARNDLDAAVRSGARAAAITRNVAGADTAARAAIDEALKAQHHDCANLQVEVDTSQLRPGGVVRTAIDCQVDLSQVTLIGLPVSKTLHADFVEPVDAYRGGA